MENLRHASWLWRMERRGRSRSTAGTCRSTEELNVQIGVFLEGFNEAQSTLTFTSVLTKSWANSTIAVCAGQSLPEEANTPWCRRSHYLSTLSLTHVCFPTVLSGRAKVGLAQGRGRGRSQGRGRCCCSWSPFLLGMLPSLAPSSPSSGTAQLLHSDLSQASIALPP